MFGLLFDGAIEVSYDTPYFEFIMLGIFALTMLFGIETTMMAVTTDAAKGIADRFQSLPINVSLAVVLVKILVWPIGFPRRYL
jgi:ABC-2 type transport system permease protein